MDIEPPPVLEKPASRQVEPPVIHRRKKNPFRSPLILWAGTAIFVFALFKGVDFLVVDKEGNFQIPEERRRKMEREIERLDEAEQYALVAAVNGLYACYNCPGAAMIDLKIGEVWKYGVTTRGEKGRYSAAELAIQGLIYVPQFVGDIKACLAEEKRKIYFYPLLPENASRSVPLIRPPGNKVDR